MSRVPDTEVGRRVTGGISGWTVVKHVHGRQPPVSTAGAANTLMLGECQGYRTQRWSGE